MNDLVKSTVAEILRFVGCPLPEVAVGGGTELLKRLLSSRFETAREIALEEISFGRRNKLHVSESDELVAITFRYLRAAQEGAARLNLRLMARVINGMLVQRSLYASDFLEFADVLATLRRSEVVYLATLLRITRSCDLVPKHDKPEEYYDPDHSASLRMKQELVGSEMFPEDGDLRACEAAVARTGLIFQANFIMDGTLIYAASQKLHKLGSLADMDSALVREGT